MTNEYSMFHLIKTLFQWKKAIAFSVLGIGILTAVITFLKPNYYKAETVFYSASPALADPSQLGYNEKISYTYGTPEDLNRLFSIVASDEMITYLITKFKLFDHYKIDSTSAKGKFRMREAFKSNYQVSKSKYDALVLSVEDTNPELAAQIANEARDHAALIAQLLVKKAQGFTLESYKSNLGHQKNYTTTLADSIRKMKEKYELIEANYQARVLADELVKAEANQAEAKARAQFYDKYESKRDSSIKYYAYASGYAKKAEELKAQLAIFNGNVSELKTIEQEYSRATDQWSIIKEKEKLLDAAFSSPFSAIHVVDVAMTPVNKSRPKRSIIILAAMLIAFLISVAGVLIIDSIKRNKDLA